MFNFRSPNFRKTGLKKEELGADQLTQMILEEPRLVRRPVVRVEGKVYFGADKAVLEHLIT